MGGGWRGESGNPRLMLSLFLVWDRKFHEWNKKLRVGGVLIIADTDAKNCRNLLIAQRNLCKPYIYLYTHINGR